MPALDELVGDTREPRVIIIAFPQAATACEEVARNLDHFRFHAVQTEAQAREIFDEEIGGATLLLTGTSSAAAEDAYYWRSARSHGVTSVAYLDQSSNLDKRFLSRDLSDWPNVIAVIDENDKMLVEAMAPSGVAGSGTSCV